jgi:membrane protease YdiL (CAAX protease family)
VTDHYTGASTGQVPLPPAGWYPDPVDGSLQRYWDGTTWTASVAPRYASAGVVTATETASTSLRTVYGPPTGRWGIGDVWWLVLVVVVSVALGVVAAIAIAVTNPEALSGQTIDLGTSAGAWLAVVTQGLMMLGLGGWPIVVARWKGPGWAQAFGFVRSWRALWVGLVGGVVTFLVLFILTVIASIVFGQQVDSAAADLVSDMKSIPLAYTVFLLFIAVGAPFVEELAFRGLMWGAIVKRGWSPWIATVVSGVVFGAFHFEPLRLVPLIAAGIVLGMIRHYAGLAASMTAHCVVNSTGVLFLLLAS